MVSAERNCAKTLFRLENSMIFMLSHIKKQSMLFMYCFIRLLKEFFWFFTKFVFPFFIIVAMNVELS